MYHAYNNYAKGGSGTDNGGSSTSGSMTFDELMSMSKVESENNNMQGWNRLDKTIKIQKLNSFAEKHGIEQHYSLEDIVKLKTFLRDCLDKSRLKNTKDVYYNKDTKEVTNIPSLLLNTTTHNFTLRNAETLATKKTVKNVPNRNTSIKDRKIINKNNIEDTVSAADTSIPATTITSTSTI
jgi:hypothetical protein